MCKHLAPTGFSESADVSASTIDKPAVDRAASCISGSVVFTDLSPSLRGLITFRRRCAAFASNRRVDEAERKTLQGWRARNA